MKRFPLVEEVATVLTPAAAFELFRHEPHAFFLDSGMNPQRLGRYSFVGSRPFLVLTSRGSDITMVRDGATETSRGNPFDALESLLQRYRLDASPLPVPFAGGAVGYFAYDLCHFIEKLPGKAAPDIPLPECYFAFYDAVLAWDHLDHKAYVVASGFPEDYEQRRVKAAKERVAEIRSRLVGEIATSAGGGLAMTNKRGPLKSNFTHDDYVKAVARAREYICAGDIFQVNISQRFETELVMPPYELYRRLREINPAPFAAFLDMGEQSVICASPERFLKLAGDAVETRPIKGTRPRGKTPLEDAALARELLDSVKDRAENIMIVDLERNDIGRVCVDGSVKVTELAILETYPTVFHLTSTVTGQLSSDKTGIDLLKASFPGGSITGAPKVRSMEIIDELEPTRRSVYTGALGYLGFNGDLDLNIVIRTFLADGNRAWFQVGGGIVYDSEPEKEYQETLDKGRALVRALGLADESSIW